MFINVGLTRLNPCGIFPTYISHNVGKNHETYIEYVDNREITLPLTASFNELSPTYSQNAHFGLFGNWNGKGRATSPRRER